MIYRYIVPVLILTLLVCCGSPPEPPPAFNGEKTFSYLVQQVALGPRVPGTRASVECRDLFVRHFGNLGAEVDSQLFSFFDPYSQTTIPLVNVIAGFSGSDQKADRIVLMAHYDSRPRTDYAHDPALREEPIDGANDGASGTAILMELGNLFARQAPPINVDLVMVDGEDWGESGDHEYYLLGSRELARRGVRDRYRFGIVIDMVGDSSQQIFREGYSERFCHSLNDAVWSAAARLNITTFHDSVVYTILDDHLPLIAAGVPTIDIIDFDYPHWHTEFDTPDKCSPTALSNVGRVLVELIYDRTLWPEK